MTGPTHDVPWKIAIVDDHAMVAEALRLALRHTPDLRPVGTATSIEDGIRLVARTQPDVLVTDLHLAEGDVIGQIPAIRRACPACKILIFTGSPDEATFLRAVAAGVDGFLDKLQRLDELTDAIRRSLRDELVIAPRFVSSMARRSAGGHAADSQLSARELEVLEMLARGTSTGEIASSLHISVNTVRNHVSRILAKLDAHSRLEAVHSAVRRGLIRVATD